MAHMSYTWLSSSWLWRISLFGFLELVGMLGFLLYAEEGLHNQPSIVNILDAGAILWALPGSLNRIHVLWFSRNIDCSSF